MVHYTVLLFLCHPFIPFLRLIRYHIHLNGIHRPNLNFDLFSVHQFGQEVAHDTNPKHGEYDEELGVGTKGIAVTETDR